MEEFKKNLEKIVSELAEHDKRIIKMEITIHGNEGKGGIYEKIESIEKAAHDQAETTKTIEKTMYKGLGFIAAICFIIPIILKFINL